MRDRFLFMFASELGMSAREVDELPVADFLFYVGGLEKMVADNEAAMDRINSR